jgi:hypothetical protein
MTAKERETYCEKEGKEIVSLSFSIFIIT